MNSNTQRPTQIQFNRGPLEADFSKGVHIWHLLHKIMRRDYSHTFANEKQMQYWSEMKWIYMWKLD